MPDPRFMRTAAVDLELRHRQLSTDGSAAVKAARLYEAMVADGASAIRPARSYPRDRPERRFLAESRAMRRVRELVPEPDGRRAPQKRAMDMVQSEAGGMDGRALTEFLCDVADEELDGSPMRATRDWFCATKPLLSAHHSFVARHGYAGMRHFTMFTALSGFRGGPGHRTEERVRKAEEEAASKRVRLVRRPRPVPAIVDDGGRVSKVLIGGTVRGDARGADG